MSKKFIIFGNIEYSYMIAKYIEETTDDKVLAFTVDKKYIDKPCFNEFPVIAFEEIENHYSSKEAEFIIGIGHKSMNSVREDIFNRIKSKGYNIGNFIHPKAIVEASEIGEGNIILCGAYIGKNAKIGNANIFCNNCNISHDAVIGDFNYIAPSVTFGGFVNVENKCFFGLGAIVKNGLSIANSTLIGAGAYIDKDTEPCDVYVPARAVKLKYKSFEMNI